MRLYKCIVSGDEMFSDTYKMKLVDEVLYEVYGKLVSRKQGDIVLGGSNPSAEETDEGTDESVESGVDIVLNHRLQETSFDKKGYGSYLKEYMKRIVKELEEKNPDQVASFKAKVMKVVKELTEPNRFKELQFFTGENFNVDGMIALMEYREIDGASIPVMMFLKHGLEEEKL